MPAQCNQELLKFHLASACPKPQYIDVPPAENLAERLHLEVVRRKLSMGPESIGEIRSKLLGIEVR